MEKRTTSKEWKQLRKLDKARKRVLPRSFPEEDGLAETLVPACDAEKCTVIHLCYFKVWRHVLQ